MALDDDDVSTRDEAYHKIVGRGEELTRGEEVLRLLKRYEPISNRGLVLKAGWLARHPGNAEGLMAGAMNALLKEGLVEKLDKEVDPHTGMRAFLWRRVPYGRKPAVSKNTLTRAQRIAALRQLIALTERTREEKKDEHWVLAEEIRVVMRWLDVTARYDEWRAQNPESEEEL